MGSMSLEYIAGMMDADGSISISVVERKFARKSGGFRSQVVITFVVNIRQLSRYIHVLEEIQNTLGVGKIYKHTSPTLLSEMSSWQTTKKSEALLVCQTLLPYLRIKKQEAAYMIEAITLWDENEGVAYGSGFLHEDWVKARVAEISTLMNVGQQKDTSRRNKSLREQIMGV